MIPYVPDELPIKTLVTKRLISKIGPASVALARYDGLLQSIVNPEVMLSPLIQREAVLSSKIEGTQATINEVLEYEAGIEFDGEKTKDIQEIINYRETLIIASKMLKNSPFNLALLRQMHKNLMNSVRGSDKTPGEFRKDQNWIGAAGSRIDQASFVPPSPLQLIDYLEAWERYLSNTYTDTLVQCAIAHAQFELIHPFKDGNGRIGRLLIPLFLHWKGILSSPMFYLSEYLESNRDAYYARLQAISETKDWNGWVVFFLDAVIAQAQDNTLRVRNIISLYDEMKWKIAHITHSQYAIGLLDALFDRPIFQTKDFAQSSGIHKESAHQLLRKLKQNGILRVLRKASGRRSAVYAFTDLLNRAEGRQVL
jgi:Fic family protein